MMTTKRQCKTGKVAHSTYSAALEALGRMARPELGSVYTYEACAAFHVSSRLFTLTRKKGRGKSRKRLVGAPC
jgi:hypothetical protein